MIQLSRSRQIIQIALPIMGAMLSQNILNLVDTAMVGQIGSTALAAVGLASIAAFLVQTPILGISAGVQAIAARRLGENKINESAYPLNASIIISFVSCFIFIPLAFTLAPKLFAFLTNSEAVAEEAIKYFDIRMMAMFFLTVNYAFRGYWNAINQAEIYMKTLIVMHLSNIVMNYLFIFGNFGFPRMEVSGAALGTSLSILLGFLIYLYQALKSLKANGFLKRKPSYDEIKSLVKISVPSGFEQFITMTGVLALYWIVGKIGTTEVATTNVLINIYLLALLPAIAFGITLASLSGQALGRGDKEDALLWGRDVLISAVIVILFIGFGIFLFSDKILLVFTQDQSLVETGILPLKIMGLSIAFEVIGFIFIHGLKGVGYSKEVMISSFVFQWLLFLPIAYALVHFFHVGLLSIWIVQISYRVIQSAFLAVMWQGGKWREQAL
ncbi:MAG: MATE family efflux transporter [Candidatus Caenarcaniphilales bacterium]|nr:MATE family efflux transporter [Candidatus Caenarcaniphilales bacterium]